MSEGHSLPNFTQRWSAYLGNFFEHYDAALFGFLSIFLAPLIFPEEDQITALILTYAMIPLGMLARPIGALVFGYIGDLYGRKQALFFTLAGMAILSGCMALSPTYQQAGMIAPVIFCVGRILQNFLASGETMGGAIFLLENAPEKKHDLLSGFYSASTMGGILLASAGVSLFSHYHAIDWGWRCLYLIGCLTGIFGFIIRKMVASSCWEFNPPRAHVEPFFKIIPILWTHRMPLLFIAIGAGFSYANYSIALILMNGFIPLVSSITKTEMMNVNTWLLVLDFCALPFFGWLSSKISREKVMMGATLGAVLSGIPLFLVLPQASFAGIIGIRICLVLFGVAFFAPFHAWAQQLIPAEHRYKIISFGYALGSQLLGGPTAALSLWAFKQTGIVSSVAWYWLALAIASGVAVSLSMQFKKKLVAEGLA